MRETGHNHEKKAQQWLEKQGCHLIANNFHCRYGEIDLIMRQNSILLFVEVRYRKHPHFGYAHETICTKKQQRIIRSCKYFLQKKPQWNNYLMRYDVVAIQGQQALWIPGAFSEY